MNPKDVAMSRIAVFALILGSGLAVSGLPRAATADPMTPVQTAALSARLFAAGTQAGDPILMIAAARLRKQIAPEPGGLRPSEGAIADLSAPLEWDDMLDAAAAAAPDDDLIAGLIADTRAESTKGVITGPIYNSGAVPAGKADIYEPVDFRGGEYAEVYIEGRGTADLNLFVYDAQNRLVCSDTDISDIAYCGWRPASTAAFTVKVENKGKTGSPYSLMTN